MLNGYRQIHCIHKNDDIYKDIPEEVQIIFDTSNYELEFNSTDRPLPKGKDENVFGLMNIRQKNNGKIF